MHDPIIDAHDIDEVLDRLAVAIKASPDADLLSGWAVATLASKLGLSVVVLDGDADAVEVAADPGSSGMR